jgi:hypothetical protein
MDYGLKDMRMFYLLVLVIIVGCGSRANTVPDTSRQPQHDCIKDDFNFDFYAHADQDRMIYCYAQLQSIARQYAQEHPERFK